MTSNRSDLHIAVFSDIHLGHRRNGTRDIIRNLRAALPNTTETAQLDILFLAGDVFDDLLSLPDEDVSEIDFWIVDLLRLCKRHDIMLRVLEGTPSHDWKQSERFVIINEAAEIGADLKYVKDLSIEYIQRHDISVLYVPDEWENTTDKTLSQARDLLQAKGLTQVDLAIMHGQFEYQLPPHVKAQKHNSAEYLKLVKDLIFIGHVHVHTTYERIIAQGSFDRLSHGEEGPKGHVRAVIKSNGDHLVTFVENTNAKRFVTVDCTGLSIEETLLLIEQRIQTLPTDSWVRIKADADNAVFANFESIIRRYPMLTWGKKVNEEIEQESTFAQEEQIDFVPITLTRDNLGNLLMERLLNTDASPEVMVAARTILKEVI